MLVEDILKRSPSGQDRRNATDEGVARPLTPRWKRDSGWFLLGVEFFAALPQAHLHRLVLRPMNEVVRKTLRGQQHWRRHDGKKRGGVR